MYNKKIKKHKPVHIIQEEEEININYKTKEKSI